MTGHPCQSFPGEGRPELPPELGGGDAISLVVGGIRYTTNGEGGEAAQVELTVADLEHEKIQLKKLRLEMNFNRHGPHGPA